ncbi:MAG: galactokinase [Gemmatimonadetes bacterium]|nr:galactokinase [Gemmatimonadota bacterium]NNF13673.1 galactokinase [Gemmatimonadota bacterium]NNL29564.1 galactokinase [Gemmatimonadota bacterium]
MTASAPFAPDALLAAFDDRVGGVPTHLSRAPGRVNLIGEHTDYNDLPVFPMALQRDVRIALRPRDDSLVVLHNTAEDFPSVEFEIEPDIPPYVQGAWGNYVKAPASELARRFAIWRGFEGVLQSDVPVASGLSSSSAVVNAVGLALAHINEVGSEPRSFAEVMADAEQYVGTRGGGMDQAISLGARNRHAAKITFSPLRLRHVNVPDDWCFVVADTGKRAEKSKAAMAAYNLRRKECEEALREVAGHVATVNISEKLHTSYPELVAAMDTGTLLEAAEDVLTGNLLRRFRHVVSEAARVEEAVDRMYAADVTGFGALMDASHASLRTDFHVSSSELDEVVAVAREGGAAGARLTGAGFGGCVVALADRWTVGSVLETLVAEYYERRQMVDRIDDRLFVAVPSSGASFQELG